VEIHLHLIHMILMILYHWENISESTIQVICSVGFWELKPESFYYFLKGASGNYTLSDLKQFGRNSLIKSFGVHEIQALYSILNKAHLNELLVSVVIWLDKYANLLSLSQLESQKCLC
jgi:hypothetical protein